jgi:hypothetical protein
MTGKHKVYHFTNTAHLPLIMASRQLVPTSEINFPSFDLLWATTKARGDLTVPAVFHRRYEWDHTWECDFVRLVRFTLRAEDFETWLEIATRCSQWTPELIELMKDVASSRGSSYRSWRCRTEPLALERWLAVETKAYRGPWQPYDYRNPDPVMVAAVRSYLAGQARQPDYECPQCGGTIKAIDVSGDDDIECSCCGWEGERQDCKLCRELFDSDALTS